MTCYHHFSADQKSTVSIPAGEMEHRFETKEINELRRHSLLWDGYNGFANFGLLGGKDIKHG